jgi:hypothetical protein
MRVPTTATPEVQEAFRQIIDTVRQLQTQLSLNVDLRGRRMINAGRGVDAADYVTKGQMEAQRSTALGDDLTVRTLTVQQRARVLGNLDLPNLDDAAVLFIRNGTVDADEAELSWRYTNKSLLLGQTVKLRWRHGIWLEQVTDPGVSVVFVISGEDDNTTTPLARVALGQDTNTSPALVVNGANLEVRKAGAGGALTEFSAKKFHPDTAQTYTATNVTTDRAFDANSTTLDEIADVVGTLLADLKTIGLVL